jgi:25S rRNA (uracil2634-N3)-methyltransferase
MSKSKTKREHRELKRDKARKLAAHQRRAASAGKASNQPPPSKKQKTDPPGTTTTVASTRPALAPAPASIPKVHTQASQKREIPFGIYDDILLVGEGDFSFTKSLAIEHGCANVTASSFDSEEEVRRKYPNFAAVEEELNGLTPPVPLHFGIDATKLGSYKGLRVEGNGEGDNGVKEGQGWDTIAFMFPHTGGLSTDVNRQVRANQALLVGFFNACLDASSSASLSSSTSTPTSKNLKPNETTKDQPKDAKPPSKPPRKPRAPFLKSGGKIIVTLFEGEPYTLWNIRDLARHAGLKVLESWRFDAGEYPGYAHVRTLGAIEGGGGWKGEDRLARMYVFEKVEKAMGKEGEKKGKEAKGKLLGKKRGREESGSESEGG